MVRKAFTREPTINKLRDELLNREVFTTLIEEWRKQHNQVWPHSARHYRPSAQEATIPMTLT